MRPFGWLRLLAGTLLLTGPVCAAPPANQIQELLKASDVLPGQPFASFEIMGLNDGGELTVYAPQDPNEDIKMSLFDLAGDKLTRILGAGDRVGDVPVFNLVPGGSGPTNQGQTLIHAIDPSSQDLLFQYAAGQLTLILAPGKLAPGGRWAAPPGLCGAPRMNAAGNVVFLASVTAGSGTKHGVYLWDAGRKQVTPVVTDGDGHTDLTFLNATLAPAINSQGEIAFGGYVQGQSQAGLYLRDAAGKLQLVAPSLQTLPDGRKLGTPVSLQLNDAGDVAFVSYDFHTRKKSLYLWDRQTARISGPIMETGQPLPAGGTCGDIDSFVLQPEHLQLMTLARLNGPSGPYGTYLWSAGQLTAMEVPGQVAPGTGGAQFVQAFPVEHHNRQRTCWDNCQNAEEVFGPSSPGQQAVQKLFRIKWTVNTVPEIFRSGLFSLGYSGALAPVLLTGDSTPFGAISEVGASRPYDGQSTAVNKDGQVAVIAIMSIGGQEHEAILLLTPH